MQFNLTFKSTFDFNFSINFWFNFLILTSNLTYKLTFDFEFQLWYLIYLFSWLSILNFNFHISVLICFSIQIWLLIWLWILVWMWNSKRYFKYRIYFLHWYWWSTCMAHQYHAFLIVKTKCLNRNRFIAHAYQSVSCFWESGNQVCVKHEDY